MPRHASLKLAQPNCIFCAGERETTSVEHMPSRILFDNKQRPKGLEFASCQECQDSTRKEEVAVAMFSRIYPDAVTRSAQLEYRKIIRKANQTFPGLLAEMHIDQLPVLADLGETANKLPTWNFITCGGPIAKSAIQKFAKKLALALHFETTNEIVPRGAGIFTMHYTNVHAFSGEMPVEFMDALGAERALVMGAQRSVGTFSYQTARLKDEATTLHMAYFRGSFALMMAIFPNFPDVPPGLITEVEVH